MSKLYKKFLEPRAFDPDLRSRELILNYLLLGTILLACVAAIESVVSYIVAPFPNFGAILIAMSVVLLLVVFLYWWARTKRHLFFVATTLLVVLLLIATFAAISWGLHLPIAILLFSLIIVMAGILLGARYSLLAVLISGLILAGIQLLIGFEYITPDVTWKQNTSNAGDISGYLVVFTVIALVSWLFNRQMEQSLHRAQRSEAALIRQKALLEIKVEQRTRALEAAQLEKMQQIYRFAELGRISSALFHDLANHLTSVSIDIQGLGGSGQDEIMQRIQHNINYIDDVVQRVRHQMRGKATKETFDVISEIKEVVAILQYKANDYNVAISFSDTSPAQLRYKADVTRFRQLIINLLSNAIDAYAGKRPTQKRWTVTIDVKKDRSMLLIDVIDYGQGIKPTQMDKIFLPFYSNKKDGTGIGLFVVKQIVEHDFKGTLSVTSNKKEGTTFHVVLPLRGVR